MPQIDAENRWLIGKCGYVYEWEGVDYTCMYVYCIYVCVCVVVCLCVGVSAVGICVSYCDMSTAKDTAQHCTKQNRHLDNTCLCIVCLCVWVSMPVCMCVCWEFDLRLKLPSYSLAKLTAASETLEKRDKREKINETQNTHRGSHTDRVPHNLTLLHTHRDIHTHTLSNTLSLTHTCA